MFVPHLIHGLLIGLPPQPGLGECDAEEEEVSDEIWVLNWLTVLKPKVGVFIGVAWKIRHIPILIHIIGIKWGVSQLVLVLSCDGVLGVIYFRFLRIPILIFSVKFQSMAMWFQEKDGQIVMDLRFARNWRFVSEHQYLISFKNFKIYVENHIKTVSSHFFEHSDKNWMPH